MRLPFFATGAVPVRQEPDFQIKAPVRARSSDNAAAAVQDNPLGQMRGRWFQLGVPLIHPETLFHAAVAMQHPVVYRCVNRIADAVASVRFRVRKKLAPGSAPRQIVDATEKQVQTVLDAPCDDFSAHHVWYWAACNFAVYGNIPVKVGRTWDGMPNAIYPLSNVSAEVVGDAAGRIIGYSFASGDGPSFQLPSRQVVEAAERSGANTRSAARGAPWAAVIAKPGLDILALDNSPTRAAVLPVELFTLLMERGRETASGTANKKYLIATDRAMTVDQEDQVFQMFQDSRVGGPRSGQVGFVSGSNPQVIALDNDLSDLHSKLPLDDMTRQICGIWGVPAALMGLGGSDNAKYAGNFAESRSAFWEETVVPGYAAPIADGLTAALCPDGYEVYADLDSVEALRDARMRRMQAAGEVPFITPNEKRKMFDFPPIAGGDVLPPPPAMTAQTQAAPSRPTDPEL